LASGRALKRASRAQFVTLNEASIASAVCHPDEASNASGRKDLGQLRVSEAGSGFRNRAALLKYITGQSKDSVEIAGEDNAAHELNAAMQDGV
jgi:hypothetical protein